MDADPLQTRFKAQSPSESPFPRNLVTIATARDGAHRRAEPRRRFQGAYSAGVSEGGLPWGSRRCERSQSCRDRPWPGWLDVGSIRTFEVTQIENLASDFKEQRFFFESKNGSKNAFIQGTWRRDPPSIFAPVTKRGGVCPTFSAAMVRAAGVLALALALVEAAAFLPPSAPTRLAHLAPHQRSRQVTCQRSGVRGLQQQGDYSLTLKSPMGIVFEEVEPGEPKGVAVASLSPLGNAAADGRMLVGDKLVSVSAAVMDKSNAPLFQLGQSPSHLSVTWDLHCASLLVLISSL